MVCWFSTTRTFGSLPWDRTGSLLPRTWVQTWPPRITLWYEEYVQTWSPLREHIFAKLSAVDDTPSPAAPPTRSTTSGLGDIRPTWGREGLRGTASSRWVPRSHVDAC